MAECVGNSAGTFTLAGGHFSPVLKAKWELHPGWMTGDEDNWIPPGETVRTRWGVFGSLQLSVLRHRAESFKKPRGPWGTNTGAPNKQTPRWGRYKQSPL